jgi:hypothetical protein
MLSLTPLVMTHSSFSNARSRPFWRSSFHAWCKLAVIIGSDFIKELLSKLSFTLQGKLLHIHSLPRPTPVALRIIRDVFQLAHNTQFAFDLINQLSAIPDTLFLADSVGPMISTQCIWTSARVKPLDALASSPKWVRCPLGRKVTAVERRWGFVYEWGVLT